MTASEWLEGENVAQGVIDLKPEGMTPRMFHHLLFLLSSLY